MQHSRVDSLGLGLEAVNSCGVRRTDVIQGVRFEVAKRFEQCAKGRPIRRSQGADGVIATEHQAIRSESLERDADRPLRYVSRQARNFRRDVRECGQTFKGSRPPREVLARRLTEVIEHELQSGMRRHHTRVGACWNCSGRKTKSKVSLCSASISSPAATLERSNQRSSASV